MSKEMRITIEPVGFVENTIDEQMDSGWADVESTIVLNPELTSILDGLESFSHALIIYWMHQAEPPDALKRRPKGRKDMPLVGLFAQRSKHRPIPIAVTAVQIVSVNSDSLTVRGLDAINGTPVIDIKPYYPQYDSRPDARVPAWVNRLMKHYF